MTEDTKEAGHQGHYIHGYDGDHNRQIIRERTAESHTAFFLPYLRPGMSLLDCGCGPGTITVGLAQAVASGEVIGLDIGETQIGLARSSAAKLGLSKVSFEVGSVYDLPYSDSRFDAVFCHALPQYQTASNNVCVGNNIEGYNPNEVGAHLFFPQGANNNTVVRGSGTIIDNGANNTFKGGYRNLTGSHLTTPGGVGDEISNIKDWWDLP